MSLRHLLTSALLVSLVACTTASTERPKAVTGPSAVDDVHSREVGQLPEHVVGDANVGFTTRVESAETPVLEDKDGLKQVIIPIGTQQPIRCFVYPKPINLAQTLRLFVRNVAKTVEKHQIDMIDAGAIKGQPYLAVTTSYLAGDKNNLGLGEIKYMAARGDGTTTLCMHDEVGYDKTFKRIATGFIGAQAFAEDEEDTGKHMLVWRELSVQRTASVAVGIIENRLYEGASGYAFASSRSVLLPTPDGLLQASDEAENQFSDPDGAVVEAKYIKIMDDEVAYNLDLNLASAKQYQVHGTFKGKEFESVIDVASALPDQATQSAQLRSLFANVHNDKPVHWEMFSPLAPGKMTDVAFEKKTSSVKQEHAGVIKEGNESLDVLIDEAGMQKKTVSGDVTVERVYQEAGHS